MIRILWLEDDARHRDALPLMALRLRAQDPPVEIVWAADSEEFSRCLEAATSPFDAIISDAYLEYALAGARNASEVINRLRAEGTLTEDIPVLFYTAGPHLVTEGSVPPERIIQKDIGGPERLRDKLFEALDADE
jgi:CheY-like chemotaxis protein